MRRMLDIAYWRAVMRSPSAATGLLVDLAPLLGVIFWGWGAVPLILLYWLENVVLGFATAARILLCSVGRKGLWGLFGGVWMVALFALHYGLFCFAHGGILLEVLGGDQSWAHNDDISAMLVDMVIAALAFGKNMVWVLALIVAWHVMVFVNDFWLRGGWKETDADNAMFAPYLRVIGLHIGVFVVAGALSLLGDPAIGALLLVLARALWGVHANMEEKGATQVAVPAQTAF